MSLDIEARIADDSAAVAAAGEQDKADSSQAAFIKSGGQAAPTGVSNWVTNLPKNITVGLFDAAVNTAKSLNDAFFKGEAPAEGTSGTAMNLGVDPGVPPTSQQRREKSLAAEPSRAFQTFTKNQRFAKPIPQGGYLTRLAPAEETAFQDWVKKNNVPFDSSAQADYDMRGFYKALQAGDPRAATGTNRSDGKLHFGDYFKTPYHKSFSAESQFANPETAPKWNDKDQLVTPAGEVVFDERVPRADDIEEQHESAVSKIMAFRDEFAKGNTADSLTQGVAQFAIPFMGWSKLLGVSRVASIANIARAGAAEAATAATTLDPQAPRMADLYQLGQHVEGKLGDALNAAAPDGSAVNAYIDFMTDRSDESAAEGRFKNVIDTLVTSGVTAGVIKAGSASLKAARKLPGYLSSAPLPEGAALKFEPDPIQTLADDALAQYGDHGTAIVHLKEQADQTLNPAERTQLHQVADRLKVSSGPGKGIKIVESPQGFTVVQGHEPTLTFAKREDAETAVADMHGAFGAAALERQSAIRADLTDKNFDTLHSFSRVLQQNVDRPVSTHSLITTLEKHLNGDTEQGAFYKELLGRLRDKNLGGTTVVNKTHAMDENYAGYFHLEANRVGLNPKAFATPERLLHTFAHEAVHAATMRELRESPRVARQMEKLMRAADAKLYAAVASERISKKTGIPAGKVSPDVAKQENAYGFTNVDEFVAEIESNPEFRAAMKKGKASDGETVWDKYLKTIAGILGITGLAVNPEFSKLMDPQEDTGA